MKLIGADKPLQEQVEILKKIIMKHEKLKHLLQILESCGLKDYYIGAGSINQLVFNYYHDFALDYGIKDFDIVYYDKDISYETENSVIELIESLSVGIGIDLDIKNEARVHLWYKDKFGIEIEPYKSCEDAMSRWGATITCVGVRLEDKELIVYAPYGLNDIFNMVVRPVKVDFKEDQYVDRAERWKNKWPKLRVISWNE